MSGYTLLSESWPIARKRHRCIWCGEHIEPGEKYRRERSVYDGRMQDHAWHPECDDASAEEFRSGEQEFAPYESERPPELSAATTKQEEVSNMDADRGGERSDGGAADEAHNGGQR